MPETPAARALRLLADDLDRLMELGAVPTRRTLEQWRAQLGEAETEEQGRFVTEDRARRRSGHAVSWLRRRYPRWEQFGLARFSVEGKREYHEAVVPARTLELRAAPAREQARRDAAA